MRVGENALAPRVDDVALGVEDDHRACATIEHIDMVLGIYVDSRAFFVYPALGQGTPVGAGDLVHEVALAQSDRPFASTFVSLVTYAIFPILIVCGCHWFSPVRV